MNNKSELYKELTREDLVKIIEFNFNETNFDYSLLKGGLFNTTYLITLISGQKLVLRVGPINRHLLIPFENNLMQAEKYFYNLCKQENLPVSNVIVCDTRKKVIDRDYMIVDYIDSIVMSEANLSKEEKDILYEQVGNYAYKIQNIKGEKFGRLADLVVGKGFSKWSDYIKNDIEQITNLHLKYNIFTAEEIEIIMNTIIKYIDILDEIKTPSLTHCDLWEGNILLSRKNNKYKIAAIIDGDRAIFADAEYEFGCPYMTNEFFIKGYGKEIGKDINSIIRRKIYWIAYNLVDCYVWIVEYKNKESGEETKRKILEVLSQF